MPLMLLTLESLIQIWCDFFLYIRTVFRLDIVFVANIYVYSWGCVVLRSEIPSDMCAKFRTVAASNNRDHPTRSLYYCLFAPHTYIFVLRTHPFVENHTINATPMEKLQQHPLLFTTNHTDRTFFVWRLNSARPPHSGHSTILLQSEILSVMCAKLSIVAARNNRAHLTRSLYYCLFAHIPFVENHTINATPPERLQQ